MFSSMCKIVFKETIFQIINIYIYKSMLIVSKSFNLVRILVKYKCYKNKLSGFFLNTETINK